MLSPSLLAAVIAILAPTAPVPKDEEAKRVAEAYGTIQERDGCELKMDEKKVLTVKLEKGKPPKPQDVSPFPRASRVSFERAVKGEFTATIRCDLKTDLLQRPKDTNGVSVGLGVKYPSGERASIDRSYSIGVEPVEPFKKKVLYASLGSSTDTGKPGGFLGKAGGGYAIWKNTALQLRVRCAGKTVHLEYLDSLGKWQVQDEFAIRAAGDGALTVSVMNSRGEAVEVVLDQFEVK